MNRRKFLESLGIGAAAVVVAPVVAASITSSEAPAVSKAAPLVEEGDFVWELQGVKPRIIKDVYEVTQSDATQVGWVQDPTTKNYLWFDHQEVKVREEFERRLELSLFENWGNRDINSLLSL